MGGSTASEGALYWAFISYSHLDAVFGRRLHRRLERYVLPRRLVGRQIGGQAVPKRLSPIFRDREELPAAHDLSAEVRAALQASKSLIVVCSPAAAASSWVSREIEVFRQLHPDRPVLAALCEGEPADAFPLLMYQISPSGLAVEPLAADFRDGRDGEKLGLLKLVAGMVGVGLDELVQRDAHRRNQRVTAVTGAALAAMVAMGVLTVFALNARSEAERQRGEALGLVKFMYTDLRERVWGVGRLDLMNVVNQRAMDYFNRESDKLTPQERGQRDLVLQEIGEIDELHGDSAAARSKFMEAWQSTDALLADAPDDPDRIYVHAQSQYWLGYDDYSQNRLDRARRRFGAYRHLAAKLVSLAPRNPRYLRELAYAEGDLCSLDLLPPRDAKAAVSLCSSALARMETVKREAPHFSLVEHDLSNRQSWLGSAYWALYDEKNALLHWQRQEEILNKILADDPFNIDERNAWISLQRNLARIDAKSDRTEKARTRLTGASRLLDEMIQLDPSNKSWIAKSNKIKAELAEITLGPSERN